MLLASGTNPVAMDEYGWTPLHFAAQAGHVTVAEKLLKASTRVVEDYGNDMGCTPLHVAAWSGNVEILDLLLRYGFNAEQKTAEGWTLAHVAAWNGQKGTLEKLQEYGTDITKCNDYGWNALHLAAHNYKLEMVKWLVDTQHIDPTSAGHDGWTALHLAASRGASDDIAKFLLDCGVYPDIKAQDGVTPIYLAFGPSHISMLKMLLSKPLNDPSVLDEIKREQPGLWQYYEDTGVLGEDVAGVE